MTTKSLKEHGLIKTCLALMGLLFFLWVGGASWCVGVAIARDYFGD